MSKVKRLMGKTSLTAGNKVYLGLALISFIVSWFPNISEINRLIMLFASVILLIIVYFSPYFKIADKIEERVDSLEKKVEQVEDLINIKSDIKLLKYEVLGHE
jgi:hypothetical protein